MYSYTPVPPHRVFPIRFVQRDRHRGNQRPQGLKNPLGPSALSINHTWGQGVGSLHHCYGSKQHAAEPDVLLTAPRLRAGSGELLCEEEDTASVDPTQLEELGGQTDVFLPSYVVFNTGYLTSPSLKLIMGTIPTPSVSHSSPVPRKASDKYTHTLRCYLPSILQNRRVLELHSPHNVQHSRY